MFTRLGEVRANHMIVRKGSPHGRIAKHMEDQIENLDQKAVKFDEASEAIEEEIEELTAGLV